MAAKEGEYLLGTPQEYALICEKHNSMPIDFICEDCVDFICTKCVKEDHKDHDWDTITTAATLKSRGLLTKTEAEDIQQIDEKIEEASQQMEENKKRCEKELSRIQSQYEVMVGKLDKIRKQHEREMRDDLASKNADMSKVRSILSEKKRKVLQSCKSFKQNSRNMTNITLPNTPTELTEVLSAKNIDTPMSHFLLRYQCGDINEETLKSMMGQKIDYEKITVTEINSFQWSNNIIELLKAINEDTCLLSDDFENVIQVNKRSEKVNEYKVHAFDMCVTDNNEVYFTSVANNSISCLSLSGSISTLFSTDPLEPGEICLTKDGGQLITLADTETDKYEPNSDSRRLVRHVTLTGDVIREYEYQEDGQTRLFTYPLRVKQNGNTDICVINETSNSTSELVILSITGSTKSVYTGHKQEKKIYLTDLVCDPNCNIILSELQNSTIILLSPEGQFMRYLLTESHVHSPTAMTLKGPTLWIGDDYGCVKVFQYKY